MINLKYIFQICLKKVLDGSKFYDRENRNLKDIVKLSIEKNFRFTYPLIILYQISQICIKIICIRLPNF